MYDRQAAWRSPGGLLRRERARAGRRRGVLTSHEQWKAMWWGRWKLQRRKRSDLCSAGGGRRWGGGVGRGGFAV